MGTRSDYYVGADPATMEWIGSAAFEGYPSGLPSALRDCTNETEFREAVAHIIDVDHGTSPEQGWPWPWETSRHTDFSYAFCDDHVLVSCFGGPWAPFEVADAEYHDPDYREWAASDIKLEWPDMTKLQNVARGPRSGIMLVTLGSGAYRRGPRPTRDE